MEGNTFFLLLTRLDSTRLVVYSTRLDLTRFEASQKNLSNLTRLDSTRFELKFSLTRVDSSRDLLESTRLDSTHSELEELPAKQTELQDKGFFCVYLKEKHNNVSFF